MCITMKELEITERKYTAMEGLKFRKINRYQTEVISDNHRIVLTNLILKYTHFIKRAKINAVVSAVTGICAIIFAMTIVQRIILSFTPSDILLLGAVGCIVILCTGVFNSSKYDIEKYSHILNRYNNT